MGGAAECAHARTESYADLRANPLAASETAPARAALPDNPPACPSEQLRCMNLMLDRGAAQGGPHAVVVQLNTLVAVYVVFLPVVARALHPDPVHVLALQLRMHAAVPW
jgi:hypothetical protein